MKYLVVILSFGLVAPLASQSTAWVTVDSGSAHVTRLNLERLRKEAPTVIDAWYEIVYAEDHKPVLALLDWPPYSRRLADSYFDCDRLQEMMLSEIFYKRDGGGAGSHTPPLNQRNWEPTPPGTIAEAVAKKACEIAKSRGLIPGR